MIEESLMLYNVYNNIICVRDFFVSVGDGKLWFRVIYYISKNTGGDFNLRGYKEKGEE